MTFYRIEPNRMFVCMKLFSVFEKFEYCCSIDLSGTESSLGRDSWVT